MRIRSLLPEDQALFLPMARTLYSGAATLHPASDELLLRNFQRATSDSTDLEGFFLEKISLNGQGNCRPLGYSLVATSWATEFGRPRKTIEELFIDSSVRSQGWGSRFLTWLTEEKYPDHHFWLEVAPANCNIQGFYRNLGFSDWAYLPMHKGNRS